MNREMNQTGENNQAILNSKIDSASRYVELVENYIENIRERSSLLEKFVQQNPKGFATAQAYLTGEFACAFDLLDRFTSMREQLVEEFEWAKEPR